MESNSISEALAELKKGRSIIVVDDQDRENEGDVVYAACKSTPSKINFLAKHARGLICVALSADRAEILQLQPMTDRNRSQHETAFTVSVEAREGVTTGISAADRNTTAKALANINQGPEDFVSPGHVFPIKARRGGVLVRAGHTEAAVDLVEMAGLGCAGVICEIMNEDGSMARLPDCQRFAKQHGLKIISVEALIEYRRHREKLIRPTSTFPMKTELGLFEAHVYEDLIHGRKHIALIKGKVSPSQTVTVRVHSECVLGDVFASAHCDCGALFQQGLQTIQQQGGVFLYMRQVRPEDDLGRKLEKEIPENSRRGKRAVSQHSVVMDARTYGIGAQILFDLGIRRLNLLTNHPKRIQGLEGYGLRIARQTPFPIAKKTKATRQKEKP